MSKGNHASRGQFWKNKLPQQKLWIIPAASFHLCLSEILKPPMLESVGLLFWGLESKSLETNSRTHLKMPAGESETGIIELSIANFINSMEKWCPSSWAGSRRAQEHGHLRWLLAEFGGQLPTVFPIIHSWNTSFASRMAMAPAATKLFPQGAANVLPRS